MRLTFFLLFLVFSRFASAQTIYTNNERFWGANEGLNNRNLHCVERDSKGLLWLGTTNGLVRFDGKQFLNFESILPNNELTGAIIFCIKERSGKIWIGSQNGLFLYDYSTNLLTNITLPKFKTLNRVAIKNIIKLPNNNLVLTGTEGAMLTYSEQKGLQKENIPLKPGVNITSSLIDNKGTIWLSTDNYKVYGYDYVNRKTTFSLNTVDTVQFLFYSPKIGLLGKDSYKTFKINTHQKKLERINDYHFDNLYNITNESDSTFWVYSRNGGLYFFDSKQYINYSHLFNKIEDKNFVINLAQRIENQFWFSTNYGLFKFDISYQQLDHFFSNKKMNNEDDKKRYPINYSVRGMTESPNGDLYFSTYQGLYKIPFPYLPEKIEPVYTTREINFMPYCLIYENNGVWIGSEGGGIAYYDLAKRTLTSFDIKQNSSSNAFVISMNDRLDKSKILLGTYDGLVMFDKIKRAAERIPLKYKGKYINATIYQIDLIENQIWLCTSVGVLILNRNLTVMDKLYGEFGRINCLYYEPVNRVKWLGTFGNGILKIYPDKKVVKIDIENGLCDNHIAGINQVNGKLYVSTYKGLASVHPITHTISNYYTKDGLSNNEFNHAATFKASNTTLFMGGLNGYNAINSNSFNTVLPNRNPFVNSIYMLNGTLESKQYLTADLRWLTIPANHKIIEFNFSFPDFYYPEKVIYAYKIEGLDNIWNNLGGLNVLRLTSLPEGKYKLFVRAAGSDGIWQNMAKPIVLEVEGYFYTKWWFFLLIVMFLILLVGLYYKIKINQLKKLYDLRMQISSDLHDEVGSILTAVGMQAELLQHSVAGSNHEGLKQISETSRQAVSNMRDVVWSIDSRNDHAINLLDRMHEYLSLMFDQSPVNYHFIKDIYQRKDALDLVTRQNTYLIFKEAINNIAKHSNPKHIYINLIITNRNLVLSIANDGLPCGEKRDGMGLQNMQMRAEKMNAKLHIDVLRNYHLTLHKEF